MLGSLHVPKSRAVGMFGCGKPEDPMSLTEGVEGSRVGLPGQAVGSTEGLGVLLGDWAEDCSRKGFGQSGPLD